MFLLLFDSDLFIELLGPGEIFLQPLFELA